MMIEDRNKPIGYPWHKPCYYCGELVLENHDYNKDKCPKCGNG